MNEYDKPHFSRLFGKATHLYHKISHKYLIPTGLHRGQPKLLSILYFKNGSTQKELSEEMNIQPATLTKMVQRMEKSGFITKKRDPEDHRITRIYLTDLGSKAHKSMYKIHDFLDKIILDGFSSEEKILLERFIEDILHNLEKALEENN
jgi:DNA-binding MarR family transcriptional regulator